MALESEGDTLRLIRHSGIHKREAGSCGLLSFLARSSHTGGTVPEVGIGAILEISCLCVNPIPRLQTPTEELPARKLQSLSSLLAYCGYQSRPNDP